MSYFELINEKGWFKIPHLLDEVLIQKLRDGMDDAYSFCREIQVKNGIDANTDGTVHHLPSVKSDVFLDLLKVLKSNEIKKFLHKYFQGQFILNSYGGVINKKNKPSYVANIHRDVRFFNSENDFMINVLVMLDDFTLDNGATHLLTKSHTINEKPEENTFYNNAERATGTAGDVVFFNSKLWHAAGINKTNQQRRAITITLTKPFFKQQLDYCRLLGESTISKLDDHLKQLLGYNSRVPSNLDEWYQPKEKRFYKADQD